MHTLQARWWAFFYKRCLVGFPWFWPAIPPGEPPMVRARRIVHRHFGSDHHPALRVIAQAFTTIIWPVAVFVHLWRIRRFRQAVEIPVRRVPGAIWAAMRHNVSPGDYYGYALWLPERRRNIDNYLYWHEAVRLFKKINRPLPEDPIGDKLAFHKMCVANALPTPAVLATFAPTGVLLEFSSGQLPERDLFIKPRTGLAGLGAERFRWCEGAFEANGRRLTHPELTAHLTARARNEKRTLLVQPLLSNHPQLGVESSSALATARLVTGYCTDGEVIPIFSLMYFAPSDRVTAQHGCVALIDVVSGRMVYEPLQNASKDPNSQLRWRPICKKADLALTLPDWSSAVTHAKAAHRACSNIAFVGWDIAFTEEGPLLLEGNANWSADEYQSLTGEPLGHTQFAKVLANRLENC